MESAKSSNVNKLVVSQSLSVQQLITKAKELEAAGKRKKALAFYIKAIRANSSQPAWIYCHTIALSIEFEWWETALLIGEKALITHSKSDKVYQALEQLYAQPVDTTNYISHYEQLIAFEPQQPEWLYYNLVQQLWKSDATPRRRYAKRYPLGQAQGNAHQESELIKEAIKVAQQGTKLYGSFYPLHYLLGNILKESEKWDKAVACYQRVKALNPRWLEVENKLNQCLQNNQTQIAKETSPQSKSEGIVRDIEPKTDAASQNQSLDLDSLFAQIKSRQLSLSDCRNIWKNSGRRLKLDYGCWLAPSILYFEAKINDFLVLNKPEVLACSSKKYAMSTTSFAIATANLIQISDNQILGVACFQNNLLEDNESYRLCINDNNSPVFITGEIGQKAYGLEFIDYLKTKNNHQKHLIRESLSSSIIKLIPQIHKPEAGKILKKLQYFLDIPPSNYVEPNLPFKIFIDYIIPLKSDGLFISGWLQDAYEMLEKITIVSALGFSLELFNQDIHRIHRNDVDQFLQNTKYGDFDGDLGFCAYAPVPQEIHDSIYGFAELHSFRFIVKLQGNIEIEIIPDAKYGDFYNARQKVMQITSPDRVSPAMLANCIAPVGLKLQQYCMEQVQIKEVMEIGSPVENPLVSIIIPLYRRLDFMKVQLATMANDPAIKECELIYVLDSPEQEEELKTLLSHHCLLYQLSVRLIIMQRNSGYAAANNAGVSQARGKYLVLLNSDVFTKTKGWVTKMADFYASSPKIGALGAKLLYEDGSLQHAGMFFTQTTFPFWLTLHYYKGLPGNYPPAQETREVPAVTGACLMISKELYDQVGGLTTDYVIGDFEDSDLCFKCRQLGYESWYYADVSLYHLERQSVPLNSSYNGSLAWLLNGRLHQERWGKDIEEVMRDKE